MPTRLFYYRLRTLVSISLVWVIFGMVFFVNLIRPTNDLGVRVTLVEFAFTFGIIGLVINAVLIFYLKPAFNHLPAWLSLIIKLLLTILLFFVIAFFLVMLYFLLNYSKDLTQFTNSFFNKLVYTNTFSSFMVDMGVMTLISIILLEVTYKYGPGMFWIMLSGGYHKPRIENRIFIFLDINESTSIAEDLGHKKYFNMLRNFFNDITLPIMANDGEIYQYVGDEIVISWFNTPANKLKSLKFIRNTNYLMERLGPRYLRRYGAQPRFKVGMHAGEVTAGTIGIIKKDLVYCGDTMNTTARIRSMCNELEEAYVISEDFMNDFEQPPGYTISKIGTMELKGRSEPIKLFALKLE